MKNFWNKHAHIISHGGFLLACSGVASHLLGFLRDRLLTHYFLADAKLDIIFAAFRLPDFLFLSLIGATLSVLFLPRLQAAQPKDRVGLLSSLWWLVFIFFGILCLLGAWGVDYLSPLVAVGFDNEQYVLMSDLSRWIFLSIFGLAMSAVLACFLQWREKFWVLALTPVIYMGLVVLGIALWGNSGDINIVGHAVIMGAGGSLLWQVTMFYFLQGKLDLAWWKPRSVWCGIWPDFWRRVASNSFFQINATIDLLIASLLVAGSVASFTLGTTLGHFLVAIVGISLSNIVLARLVKINNLEQRLLFLWRYVWIILGITVPLALVGAFYSQFWLKLVFALEGEVLQMTDIVFWWTVISSPGACLFPLLARWFLADANTKTPLMATGCNLLVATMAAFYLSLFVWTGHEAIRGLAIGNFVANYLGVVLFTILIWRDYSRKTKIIQN